MKRIALVLGLLLVAATGFASGLTNSASASNAVVQITLER